MRQQRYSKHTTLLLAVTVLCCDRLEEVRALSRIRLPVAKLRHSSWAARSVDKLDLLLSVRGGASSEGAASAKNIKDLKKGKDNELAGIDDDDEDEDDDEVEDDEDIAGDELVEVEDDEDEDEDEEADDDQEEEESEEKDMSNSGKKAIDDAMKEKDAAEALGDAIRYVSPLLVQPNCKFGVHIESLISS